MSGLSSPAALIAEAHSPGILVHLEQDAARMLNLSARTMQRMRLEGTGPRYIQLTAQRIGYRPEAFRDWLEAREVASTAAAKVGKLRGAARA